MTIIIISCIISAIILVSCLFITIISLKEQNSLVDNFTLEPLPGKKERFKALEKRLTFFALKLPLVMSVFLLIIQIAAIYTILLFFN